MLVYNATKQQFIDDVRANVIANKVGSRLLLVM